MNILALDTSMGACSVAVLRGAGCSEDKLFRAFDERRRGHAEALTPMVSAIMAEAELSFSQIDLIAVTRGPGTFTGVRVGVAAARGFALATGIPLVSETSLAVIGRGVVETTKLASHQSFVVAVDARRDELYVQSFSQEGQSLGDAQALSPENAVRALPKNVTLAVGSGASLLVASAEKTGRKIELGEDNLQPDAAHLALMATQLPPAAEPVKPLYLRPPDAKPQVGKSIERAT